MRRHLSRVVVAVTAAVVVAVAGGVTYAVADIGGGGVINGCYKSQNGQLRLIDPASGSCNPSEAAISWNQTGPPVLLAPPGLLGLPVRRVIQARLVPPAPPARLARLGPLERQARQARRVLLGRRAQLVRQAPRVRPARPSNHSPLENRTHSASPALGTSTSAAGRVPQAPKGTSWDSAATSVQPRHSGSMTPSLGSATGPRARTASTTTRPQTLNSPATATSAFEWRMARRVARGTSTSKALTTRAAPASRRPPEEPFVDRSTGRPHPCAGGASPSRAYLTASAHETLVWARRGRVWRAPFMPQTPRGASTNGARRGTTILYARGSTMRVRGSIAVWCGGDAVGAGTDCHAGGRGFESRRSRALSPGSCPK